MGLGVGGAVLCGVLLGAWARRSRSQSLQALAQSAGPGAAKGDGKLPVRGKSSDQLAQVSPMDVAPTPSTTAAVSAPSRHANRAKPSGPTTIV